MFNTTSRLRVYVRWYILRTKGKNTQSANSTNRTFLSKVRAPIIGRPSASSSSWPTTNGNLKPSWTWMKLMMGRIKSKRKSQSTGKQKTEWEHQPTRAKAVYDMAKCACCCTEPRARAPLPRWRRVPWHLPREEAASAGRRSVGMETITKQKNRYGGLSAAKYTCCKVPLTLARFPIIRILRAVPDRDIIRYV